MKLPTLSVNGRRLLLLSLSVLFLELTLIRWLGSTVRVVAYFPNLVLIAVFFGLGVGSVRQKRKSLMIHFPFLLIIIVATAILMGKVIIKAKGGSEFFWLLYYDLPRDAPVLNNIELPLIVFFVLVTLCFVPLGQELSNLLVSYKEQDLPLEGYIVDLSGSFVGIIAFTAVSFLRLPPVLWMLVGCVLVFLAVDPEKVKNRLAFGLVLLLTPLAVFMTEKNDTYSPYYALRTANLDVLTNGSLHQRMIPVKRGEPKDRYAATASAGFNYPFDLLKNPPKSAVVFGAGTGNDVAVLLDRGVERIVAVEIDPLIQEIGTRLHPNRPYDDPRVEVVINDARSYINTCDEKFDLIIFGTLDSMTRLSALSNVRLDNYVYTQESIEQAAGILTESGGMVLHFRVTRDYIVDRMVRMTKSAFDAPPIVKISENYLFNLTIMAGPAFAHVEDPPNASIARTRSLFPNDPTPTDDWPYLYLQTRSISPFYVRMVGWIILVAAAIMGLFCPEMRTRSGNGLKGADSVMFLFGLAFLLLSTRAVTQMGLIWGNTWLVNSVVFASIMFVILLSTIINAFRPLGQRAAYCGLFLCIMALYFVPIQLMPGLPYGLKLLASAFYVAAPFFFAGTCFANNFKDRDHVELAFGWNIIGALFGGLLEFASMIVGLKALFIVALAAYFTAFLIELRQPSSPREDQIAPEPEPRPESIPTVNHGSTG
jgi:hypothetical protein